MNGRLQKEGLAIGLALILFMVMLTSIVMLGQPALAAPPAAPTPVVTGYSNDKINPPLQFWAAGDVITQDGGSSVFLLADAEALDVQLKIEMPTVNTTTFTMQFSNDGENWVNGLAVGSALVTDTSTLQQYANFGYYTRIYADVTNSEEITIDNLSAVARR